MTVAPPPPGRGRGLTEARVALTALAFTRAPAADRTGSSRVFTQLQRTSNNNNLQSSSCRPPVLVRGMCVSLFVTISPHLANVVYAVVAVILGDF